MRHLLPNGEFDRYLIAVLVRKNAFNQVLIKKHITDLLDTGDIVIFDLKENEKGNVPVGTIKDYLKDLLPALVALGSKYLFVADSAYYKALTDKKVSVSYGYVNPCVIKGFEDLNIVAGVNPKSFYFDPLNKERSDQGIQALNQYIEGTYEEIGMDVIHSAEYPCTLSSIRAALLSLHKHPVLVCDIEAFSLNHTKAGVGTIGFAWDEHNGVAFPCDYAPVYNTEANYGKFVAWHGVRKELKQFLIEYKGTLIYHNGSYDTKVIIYTLFMKGCGDTEGLLHGLEVMTRSIEDTKLIAYHATNTTAGNVLGLKPLAQEYLGDYAEDVEDIALVPLDDLLEYNLKDCLGTWYVFKKYMPILIAKNQEHIYRTLQLPRVKVCLQMELNGMPLDSWKVGEAKIYLSEIQRDKKALIMYSPEVRTYTKKLRKRELVKANLLLKKKQHKLSHFDSLQFNLNSNQQLAGFIYEELGFECTKFTKGGAPATGNKIVTALALQCKDPIIKDLLLNLVEYIKVTKLITSFIPAFEAAIMRGNGRSYLYGNFQIGGTVSNRLSCKEPNLQQIPSNSDYAKCIKQCFVAPEGWIFAGSDFNALESTVGAKITQDPNRLKIFTDGFDSHCFNTYHYKMVDMPDIEFTVESINSIKKKYPDAREYSKPVTFALDYLGTEYTIMDSTGKTREESRAIYENYHTLYQVSDKWRDDQLVVAETTGYVTGAFGLRVHTPVIHKTLMNTSVTPSVAAAEARSAGNALTQSYCVLTDRAAIEFQERLLKSPYSLDVLPVAMIHDAIYVLMRDDIDVVEWVNTNLIECMAWNDLPELQQDDIPLGGNLDLFYGGWHQSVELPNGASQSKILELADNFLIQLTDK
jgi:DNA polymerase-1